MKRATTSHDDDDSVRTPPEKGPQRTEPSVDLPEARVPQRTEPSDLPEERVKSKLRVSEATAIVLAAIKRKRAEKAEEKKAEEKAKGDENARDEGIPKRQKTKMAPLDTPCPKRKELDEHTPPRTGDPDERKMPAKKKAKTSADNLQKEDSSAKPPELPIEGRIFGTEKGKIVKEESRSNWRVRHGKTSKSFSFKEYGNDEKAFTAALAYLDSL